MQLRLLLLFYCISIQVYPFQSTGKNIYMKQLGVFVQKINSYCKVAKDKCDVLLIRRPAGGVFSLPLLLSQR